MKAYDLSPLVALLGIAAVLAAVPLLWIWLRRERHPGGAAMQHALTLMTLFLTFDLILVGAFTRLTDSGLGCPDWPGCYGHSTPAQAHGHIAAAQEAMPTGPVTHTKAWIEMAHRYMAMLVGALILASAALAWVSRVTGRAAASIDPWWPTFALGWVLLQGAFGALTVTMKLFPAIVTIHLLGGIGLLALLCVQATRQAQAMRGDPRVLVAPATRALLWVALAMTVIQAALGGWVSTNYAVLACNTFPQCQGSLWPAMDFAQGFELWRDLGKTAAGDQLAFPALTAIHYTHRLFAYALFAVLGVLCWKLASVRALPAQARCVAGLAAWQLATGVSNVVFDWPLAAAVSHTGGAAVLVAVLAWALCESGTAPAVSHAASLQAVGRASA